LPQKIFFKHSMNRLDNITVEGKVFDYEFYPDGMLKAVNYPITAGGQTIRSEYTYDNINRLETVINQVGSQIISQYSYGYDSNGNITSVTENSSTTEYQYDDVNRLEGTTKPNGEEITYHYDTRGNRTNHIGNTTITYNTIADTYGYNNWDELSQFATGGIAYQYQYDPEGLRAKKESTSGTVRYHLDNNGRVIAESDASDQITAQNIWGHKALARKVNGAYYYYIYNGHGDVVQVLDVNGIVVNSYSYDEWGNITSKTETIENPIRYAGEYYDEESGLYYLRARYYDPTTGRFISEHSCNA
jgi:YD repeat-containing protein